MIDRIGGRKITVGLITLLLGVGVTILKGDVPPGFLLLLQTVFSAFVVGNAVEHLADRGKTGEARPGVDNTTIVAAVDAAGEKLLAMNEQLMAQAAAVKAFAESNAKLAGAVTSVLRG